MNQEVKSILERFDKQFKERNQFGIKIMPGESEPYKCHVGRTVELSQGGNSFCGVYRGLEDNGDEFILYPFASPQTFPESVISGEKTRVARIIRWADRPAQITRAHTSILPVDEEYLLMRIAQAREFLSRIFLP